MDGYQWICITERSSEAVAESTKMPLFPTDRGSEFVNHTLQNLLDTFGIERSLSHKGTPYDNAVAGATFKSIKFEFVYPNSFRNLEQLRQELAAYVWWYNHERLHSTFGYVPPIEFKQRPYTIVYKSVDIPDINSWKEKSDVCLMNIKDGLVHHELPFSSIKKRLKPISGPWLS